MESEREGLRDRLLAQTRKEKTLGRKKLLRLALIIAVAVTAFLILYPHLKVAWYIRRAQGGDTDARTNALQWLAERQVKKAVPVFIKSLEGTAGESEFAMQVLRTLAGKEIIPELVNIWESKSDKTPGYAKHNALQLIAEKGDKSHTPIFVSTQVLLGKGWDSAWDFLRKNADASIVEMILKMLSGDDVLKRRAAAMALRPIKEMEIVKKNEAALDALAKAVNDPDWVVRREALRTISGIARPKDFETILNVLTNDENSDVRTYAAEVLGELRDKRAIPGLVRSLKDPEGSVCLASADALVKIGSFDCTSPLAPIIQDEKEDSLARVQAIGVLRRIRAPGAAQILSSVLKSPDSRVAVEAAKSLARVGTSESISPLAEAARSANAELRLWSAYALGLIGLPTTAGEPAAQEVLLHLLQDSELQVVRVAAHALVVVGTPAYADKSIEVFDKLDPQSENSREIAHLLTIYRTPKSISTLTECALSAYPQLREEGRLGLKTIGEDILSNMKMEKSHASEIILSSAATMFDKEAGSKLSGAIKSMSAQANEQIDISALTSIVLKAVRDLPSENKPDRDELETALLNARTFYWTVTLLEGLKAAGIGEEKIISQAQELVSVTDEAEPFEKVPTGETASKLRGIAKELNLPAAD
jgi:hypothetical protein